MITGNAKCVGVPESLGIIRNKIQIFIECSYSLYKCAYIDYDFDYRLATVRPKKYADGLCFLVFL